MTEYDFHPVCLAFPAYEPYAYAERLEDYRKHPEWANESVVLLAKDDADDTWKIADGRHHYLICKELGYKCEFEKFKGGREELAERILFRNAHRRHCNETQIAAALIAVRTWTWGTNRHTAVDQTPDEAARAASSGVRTSRTQSETAAKNCISPDTLQRANKVAKAVPELIAAMRDKKIDAKTAAKVADLPAADRKAVAAAADPKAEARKRLASKKGEGGRKNRAPADGESDQGGPTPEGAEITTAPAVGDMDADEFVSEVEDICRAMDRTNARIRGLAANPHSYSIHVDSAAAQSEAARKTLWQGRPCKPCPYCRAAGEVQPKCRACRGLNRVKPSSYDAGVKAVGGGVA